MGVKGNAFRELTLVAGPNVSDGFLSFFDLPSSSPRCIPILSHTPRQLDPTRRVVDPDDEREKRGPVLSYGSCSRFLESLISVLLVLFPCCSSPA